MERNSRKTLIGRVVSTDMDKTITVLVESKKEHAKYKKQLIRTKKYKAHDEKEIAQMGDLVKIMETKPFSATKRSMLVEVIEKGVK